MAVTYESGVSEWCQRVTMWCLQGPSQLLLVSGLSYCQHPGILRDCEVQQLGGETPQHLLQTSLSLDLSVFHRKLCHTTLGWGISPTEWHVINFKMTFQVLALSISGTRTLPRVPSLRIRENYVKTTSSTLSCPAWPASSSRCCWCPCITGCWWFTSPSQWGRCWTRSPSWGSGPG